jgi:queuine/archaeosine tRNA-ribosyltransferase
MIRFSVLATVRSSVTFRRKALARLLLRTVMTISRWRTNTSLSSSKVSRTNDFIAAISGGSSKSLRASKLARESDMDISMTAPAGSVKSPSMRFVS